MMNALLGLNSTTFSAPHKGAFFYTSRYVNLLTMNSNEKLEHLRHSLSHLLAAAVLELYPDAKNTLGPAIETGFYYDFEFKKSISDEDLPKIEKKMREILPGWQNFAHEEFSVKDAKKHFERNPYKLEMIDEIESKGEKITFYTSGDFTDLCRGGHADIADMKNSAWKLSRTAGAYWRGDEKNKMLTRIYGLAFETNEELDAYEKQMEEAKKRDHKRIGKELDLFTFSDLVGGGLPLWTPKGTLIRDLLDNFVWELRAARGYERVDIPHITKKELYEKSGHWEKFKDELFQVKTREGHTFVMKPMNCPHHTQIYARKQWSYRELPQRYASTTKVYRDEQSGELSGLSRVRAITQDDAHVFCRQSQAVEEMSKIWDIVSTFYDACGFLELVVRLSFHDPNHKEKFLGGPDMWRKMEDQLSELVKIKKADAAIAHGEAAFYGPKVDFIAHDSLGRRWQVATIQLDMNMPERFDLSCVGEDGKPERIVMIHAAIMGSIERFLSILIEHTAGIFPLWLSPVQVKILPIGEDEIGYAKEFTKLLKVNNIRAELDDSNESLGKKIRNAKTEKVPYLAVIGKKETESDTITLESRTGSLGALSKDEILKKLLGEVSGKS